MHFLLFQCHLIIARRSGAIYFNCSSIGSQLANSYFLTWLASFQLAPIRSLLAFATNFDRLYSPKRPRNKWKVGHTVRTEAM